MKNLPLIIIALLLFNSCKVYKKVNLPSQIGIVGYSGNNNDISKKIAKENQQKLRVYEGETKFYPYSKKLNWGLAMSGGGIRSAAVNIGAIKALYDMKILDSIQIISSVSGGSYASGWFFSNEIQNQTQNLGKPFLSNENFINEICKIRSTADMMKTPTMLINLLATPNKAFSSYQDAIERTFINNKSKGYTLNNYKISKKKHTPYFIINSTIDAKKNNDWLTRVYENTPYHRGNPEIGFLENNDLNSKELIRAITISGAAVKRKLLQKEDNHSNRVKSSYLPLSDGGKSENLGAIALIRRGVKNVIIIDAEQDKKLKFKSYKILKEKLKKELSVTLSIPEIDSFLNSKKNRFDKSFYKGSVKTFFLDSNNLKTPNNINIFYMKLALPESIKTVFRDSLIISKGESLKLKLKCGNSNMFLKKSDFYALSAYWSKKYSTWLNKKLKWKLLGYKFPHTYTLDQSFYVDQFSAFVGLGYLQTSEIFELIKDKLNPTVLRNNVSEYKLLRKHEPILQMTSFESLRYHGFNNYYLKDSKFIDFFNSLK